MFARLPYCYCELLEVAYTRTKFNENRSFGSYRQNLGGHMDAHRQSDVREILTFSNFEKEWGEEV